MKKHIVVSWIRALLASLVFIAVTVQLIVTVQTGGSIANFFSFFTIESNIFTALLLLYFGLRGIKDPTWKPKATLNYIRGALTLYMTMTGVIYIILLAGNDDGALVPWINTVLHYIMPVAALIDWLLHPPAPAIPYKKAIWWLAFPLTYLLYTFIRGSITGWYPYPFLDPTINGWSYIVMMCFIIMIGVIVGTRILAIRPRVR